MTPRDDDEKRADKHRGRSDRPGENGAGQNGSGDQGADWLLSQLDDTGAYSTIDDEPAPRPENETRWSRRRFRRRQERAQADGSADAGEPTSPSVTPSPEAAPREEQPLDDDAPTRAFDAIADRPVEKPVVPPRRTDGVFAWGLTPNDAVDPLVAAQRETDEQKPDANEPAAADAETTGVDAGEPTQAFDPFADHEFEPVSPEQAAVDEALAKPGAYERLYGEATLSALDAADDDDAVDEPNAEEVPAPKSAVAAEPADDEPALAPEPVDDAGVIDDEPLPADETSDQDAVDEDAPAAPGRGEDAEQPEDSEQNDAPDLGILDLFGGRTGESPGKAAGTPETPPATPEPAWVSGSRSADAPSSAADSDTSARLRALFESTATAPAPTQAPAADTRAEPSAPRASSAATTTGASSAGGGSGGGSRGTRPLVLVGLAVAAIVVLGGLFWVGTLIPGMVSASQPEATESSTPTPTQSLPAEGTLPAGTYAWDQLRGGECLGEYQSPWAEEFTVVDCEAEHDAQLVAVGTMSDDEGAAFPGEDELASQIYLLCSDPGVIDLAKAGEYGDVQVQGSYPVTEEQWNDGQRNYYCFVDRASGEPLTGSLVPAE
ncbi:septum formation family protein [Paramicrobacterium agarici]|uniref:Putative regulator of septum formation n=1 Tax=Paramicrobacterium agarici TaxID=630514 RepID=A0A2A9DU52_9MICO|nr:septum formation family protein [Microbacterium agarici]PFG30317.1 putative regulator of septum formation [Microbacterium agarici]